ncbi:MAG: hypothetical protein QM500_00170 [Methylococcales bacterium]
MNIYILAFALVTSFITSSVHATLIDDFSDGSMHLDADTLDIYQSSSSAFGGGRSVSIIKQGSNAKADIIASLGLYAHSTNAQSSATSTILWSSSVGVDLVEIVNNNAFALDIYSNDLQNSNFVLSVSDTTNNQASFTLFNAGEGIQNIMFSSFAGIDFQQINDISLQIVGGLEADLVISSLSTTVGPVSSVPTPAAFLLFSSSLVMLISFSRR